MWKKILKYALWLLLAVTYGLIVYCNTPSHSSDNPDCTEYSNTLSGYEVIIAATDDTLEQNTTEYDEKTQSEAQLACSDLHAQWAMADVTFWAFWAGIAGIGLVFLTWIATRAGATVSRRSTQDQTMAYVHIDKATFSIDIGGLPAITLFATNTGSTPARWFEIGSISETFDPRKNSWLTPSFNKITDFERWPALANGTSLSAGSGSADEAKVIARAGKSKDQLFLVYGIIRYETVFGEIFETQFAFNNTDIIKTGLSLTRPPIFLETYKQAKDQKSLSKSI